MRIMYIFTSTTFIYLRFNLSETDLFIHQGKQRQHISFISQLKFGQIKRRSCYPRIKFKNVKQSYFSTLWDNIKVGA